MPKYFCLTSYQKFPFGTHKWQFTNNACNDGAETDYRSLNLHLVVEEIGKFCCDSGLCIESEEGFQKYFLNHN